MDGDWLSDNAWALWLGGAIVLGLAELLGLDLVLLMLAVGAGVGMVTALLDLPVVVQVLAAAGTSVAMLVFVRPNVVRRMHHGPDLKHGPAKLVGREGFALAEVSVHAGQVKLAGEVWTARPYDDSEVIPVGAKVQIIEIRGATAYVHEVPS